MKEARTPISSTSVIRRTVKNLCISGGVSFVAFALLLSPLSSAQTLTGTVKNTTTGKPGSGDEVVLLKIGSGMEEAGHTKADSKGNFSFKLDDTSSPHVVRAIHQSVTFHRMAPPGTTSVEVEVSDVAKRVSDVSVVADVMRVQVEQGQLEVQRMFAVQNSSKPPRTQMDEHDLEFYLPEGAKIVEASAMTAHGNPLKTDPVPEGEKNRYAFFFPLRPGMTQFEIAYQLPYTGSANIDPRSVYPLEHFVAILPKGIQFTAATNAGFKPMNDPNQPDANVQVASSTGPSQSLAFKISGEGKLQERVEGGTAQGAPSESGGPAETRPGGGLGPPIDAPDPLQKYRWPILALFGAALIAGGVYVATRQQAAARAGLPASADEEDAAYLPTEAPVTRPARPPLPPRAPALTSSPVPGSHSSMLLTALKEEIFQLEVEHKRGIISQLEYEKAKSALDQTLERALKRDSAS